MGDAATAEDFAEDIVLLEQSGLKPVVCHGGGPQIAAMLKKLGMFALLFAFFAKFAKAGVLLAMGAFYGFMRLFKRGNRNS
eukprot:gene68167-93383_t